MSGSPSDSVHFMRAVTEKATSQNPSFRYNDANGLLKAVEKTVKYNLDDKKVKRVRNKMRNGIIDEDVENYIYELDGNKLCRGIMIRPHFTNILLKFMENNESRTLHILELVCDNYRDVCGRTFSSYDPFATFAYNILIGDFPYVAKERSASILNYVAYDVNRFSAQDKVEELISHGIEPLLEEKLK